MNSESLKYDILRELFNISVGKAASILSEMIDQRILLNVPQIEILNTKDMKFKIDTFIPKILDGSLMVSSISFMNKLTGQANLIFPAEKMRTFINLCSSQEEASESNSMEFTDIDFDIIKEIGNIILNSIIGGIGNSLGLELNYTLPEVKVFNRTDFENSIIKKDYLYILTLYITFRIDDVEIEGAVIINLTLESINELINKIDRIEDELYG